MLLLRPLTQCSRAGCCPGAIPPWLQSWLQAFLCNPLPGSIRCVQPQVASPLSCLQASPCRGHT